MSSFSNSNPRLGSVMSTHERGRRRDIVSWSRTMKVYAMHSADVPPLSTLARMDERLEGVELPVLANPKDNSPVGELDALRAAEGLERTDGRQHFIVVTYTLALHMHSTSGSCV